MLRRVRRASYSGVAVSSLSKIRCTSTSGKQRPPRAMEPARSREDRWSNSQSPQLPTRFYISASHAFDASDLSSLIP